MEKTVFKEHDRSDRRGWLIVLGLAIGFFLWGMLIFYSVGDKGPPPWGFGEFQDIPGESPYSTHRFKQQPGPFPYPVPGEPVAAQHVLGQEQPKPPQAKAAAE